MRKRHIVLCESSCIDVRMVVADHTSDFHDMAMFGGCCRLGKVDVENGPTSSACYVEQWAVVYDGYGMLKIMYGRRSTRRCKNDGFMSMPAKKLGIIHGYT